MNPAEDYILKQPQDLQDILLFVRSIIFKTVPEVEEKYKYKIPFYYYCGKPLCYLNILKGKHFVDVGFWAAYKLPQSQHLLVKRDRKMMYSLECHSLETIDVSVLTMVLEEAKVFNENAVKYL